MADLRTDRSEKVKYNTDDLPVYVRKGRLSTYPNHKEVAHWHNDIELIAVLSGSMSFSVNGTVVELRPQEGIFVNTKQVHYGFSDSRSECEFICVLIEPFMLYPSDPLTEKFILPVVNNQACPYYVFDGAEKGGELFSAIAALYELNDAAADFPLNALSLCFRIWAALYGIEELHADAEKHDSTLAALRKMLAYLCEHYNEKLTLNEIARAGNVCKSGCNAIFKQYLHQTPIDYLIGYRLEKAKQLLAATDLKVTEISLDVGFPSVSHFIDMFKRAYGVSPKRFRMQAERRGT